MAYAYVTMTDSAYAAITAVMLRSLLNTKTSYPIVVLGLPGFTAQDRRLFEQLSPQISVRLLTDIHPASRRTINKIQIWTLTEYERVVFLDSDMLILKNIDELFSCKQLAAASEYYTDYASGAEPQGQFNSGVLVVEPALAVYDRLYRSLKELPALNARPWAEDKHGDQPILWAHFLQRADAVTWRKKHQVVVPAAQASWQILPWYYNAVLGRRFHFREIWQDQDVRIIHFAWVAVRPWDGGHTRYDWQWLWTAWSLRRLIDVRPYVVNRLRFIFSIYFVKCVGSSLKKYIANKFGHYYE